MKGTDKIFSARPRFSERSQEIELQEPFTITIFGGAGDLSQRKLLPALYHLFLDGWLTDYFVILGIGK